MNRTKIEWTDYTWNPVTGCWGPGGTAEKPARCFYCYAHKLANRFPRNFNRWHEDPFVPRFAMGGQMMMGKFDDPAKVKKPSKIFVCSMGDLFGDWVPDEWIFQVLVATAGTPHTFQFLTKNPKRLKDFNPWPSNCWVGTTVTNQADADERIPWLLQVDAPVRFVSHEPLLGDIFMRTCLANPRFGLPIHWAILGAMSGPGAVKPKLSWVLNLSDQYGAAGVPVFHKNNCPWPGAKKIQEWPA